MISVVRRLARRDVNPISLDITPALPHGRQVIQSYGGGGFRVSDQSHQSSILLNPKKVFAWQINDPLDITIENISPILNEAGILIVGCGANFVNRPVSLRTKLRDHFGISLEWMDTGAACRTFDVLLIEDRDVAAALIAVD